MSKPTADWERVGDRFYRKIQLYTSVFDQDLELENYQIAGAPFSGAVGRHPDHDTLTTLIEVALHRDVSKVHSYRGTAAAKSSIDVYSCAGKLIHSLPVSQSPVSSSRIRNR